MKLTFIIYMALLSFLAFPTGSLAQELLILPVQYEIGPTASGRLTRAVQLESLIAQTAAKAGWTIIERTEAAGEYSAATGQTLEDCGDQECLEALIEILEADEAILLTVSSSEEQGAMVKAQLMRAQGLKSTLKHEQPGARGILDNWVQKTVQKKLAEHEEWIDRALPFEEFEIDAEQDEKKGLRPAAFWVAAGVTGALLVSAGIVGIVGRSVKEDYLDVPEPMRSESEWKKYDHLVTAQRVLLVSGLAGVALSTVLFFVTDFGKTRETPPTNLALKPYLSPTGQLGIVGTF